MQDATRTKMRFRTWLMLLSAFASLPMILFSVLSLIVLLEHQRDMEKNRLVRAAEALSGDLERHLAARASMLVALANGDAAKNDDLPALYGHAARLVASSPGLSSISLVDHDGNILFNTLRPYGVPLPKTSDPDSARRVIETGQPRVSAVFEGTISHQRVTALGIAVSVDGQRKYCLRAIAAVTELEDLLAQQHLPVGWSAAVLDAATPVVVQGSLFPRDAALQEPAREAPASRPDQPDTPEHGKELIETALVAVGNWGWRVAVSVPESAFVRPLYLMLVKFGVVGVVCLLASMLASFWLARRLTRDVSELASASISLATGHPTFDGGTIIKEMGEVRACLLAARDREEQAMTDPLTGLPGRARFWELAGELERNSQGDMDLGLAVMFIDLDGFKQVNDRYGHGRGDWMLHSVAEVMRDSVRSEDVVGRLGGDEFAVCLTARRGHLIPAASSIAERIVGNVGKLGYGIGCSIGVSVCEVCSPDLSRALTLADQAMYEAKRLGKNRYVLREDTTP
jgi:diguanylate cyclase (GGDEF)-like protein